MSCALTVACLGVSVLTFARPALAQTVISVGSGEVKTIPGDYPSGDLDGGAVQASGTLNVTGTLNNNATLTNDGTLTNNFGTIKNNATLTNRGTLNNSGTLNNTDTFNNSGYLDNTDLITNSGSFDNSSSLNNSGGLTNTGTFTNSGILTNIGTLTNTGTFTSTGSFTNIGTVKIGEGGTSGTLAGDVTNDSSVVFNRSDASSYADVISGTGTLTKRGAGALTLSGTNTYTGATTVEAGTLLVNGSIAGSATTVASGATLGGSGDLGGVTVQSGGFFAPGNSIASNTATSLDLTSGATFAVEINDGGFTAGTNNDHTTVTGTATIADGAIVAVSSYPAGDDGSTYTSGRYTILDAATLNVAGTITISESFAFLDFTYGFDSTSLWLDSTLNAAALSLCLTGSSDNECATGKGVASLGTGSALYQQLLGMTDAQALAAQNALSGEVHASAQSVFIESSRFVRNAALERLRAAFDQYGGNDTPILSYLPASGMAPAHDRSTVWAQGFGSSGELDGNDNAADLDSHEYGFLGGVEGFVADDWRLGLLAGYSRTDFDVDDRSSSGDSDNLHLGLYGGTEFGNLGLRAGLAQSWHWVDTKRQALGETLKANYDARTFQAFTEIGYRIDAHTAWLEPFANLAYVRHHTEAFSESGGDAALDVDAETTDTGFTTLGVRGAVDFVLGNMAATARGSAGWRHAFGDKVPESVNAFAGGADFTVEGTPIAEDAAVIEAGLDFAMTRTATLGLSYAGQFSSGAQDHAGRMKVDIRF